MAVQIFDLRLLETVVVSVIMPNASLEVNNKHNLEPSTIQSATFAAGFPEVILIFKTFQYAPFMARFWDIIKLELHRKYPKLEVGTHPEKRCTDK